MQYASNFVEDILFECSSAFFIIQGSKNYRTCTYKNIFTSVIMSRNNYTLTIYVSLFLTSNALLRLLRRECK